MSTLACKLLPLTLVIITYLPSKLQERTHTHTHARVSRVIRASYSLVYMHGVLIYPEDGENTCLY
jgi:hypothetical protein